MEKEQRRDPWKRVDFSKVHVVAESQGGPLDRAVGLTGKYTPRWALQGPEGVDIDLRYVTYVAYIKSFLKTSADEPDRVLRGQWNDGLRRYTSGTKYFKEWKAQKLAPYIRNPYEDAFSPAKVAQSISDSVVPDELIEILSQSGEIRQDDNIITSENEVVETMEFQTDVEQVEVSIDTDIDSTRLQASVNNTELGDYLSRPLKIGSHNLTNGFYLDLQFNPWHDFLSNPNVINKLQNYSLIRGVMHVKFLINGGPFYFGNIICGYKPRGVGYEFKQGHSNATEDYFQRATLLSQRQHIILNPTISQGGELTLPFFHPKNYLNLISADDILNMGEVSMISLAPLDRALGATEQRQINITVMAWMSDVELAGPTTLGVLSQAGHYHGHSHKHKKDRKSKPGKDEYGQGIISRPAKAIARFAGKLSMIPEIGPFATATNIAAESVGKVAEMFGFSRPIVVEPIRRYRHQMYGILANSSIDEAAEKLTYDPKQELTVDHNITGAVLQDELTISSITSKSSLLTYFTWSATENENALIGTINVHPTHLQFRNDGTSEYGVEWVQTPLSHASLPFKYWRGGLIFRFQINASDLHRGRLLLVYEPRRFSTTAMPDTNTVFTRILDLEQTKDFTLPIHWFQDKSWAKILHEPTTTGIAKGNGTPANQEEYSNGQLRIYVLNELTSPDEDLTNSVRILTWIAGADDFELAVPDDALVRRAAFAGSFDHTTNNVNNAWSQSGILNNAKTAAESQPGHDGTTWLEPIGEYCKPEALSLVYHGETFDSFRDMLRRYTFCASYARSHDTDKTGRVTRYRLTLPNFPMYNGRSDFNGMYAQVRTGGLDPISYNITGRTLLNWLTPAFAARRGGIRYKYYVASDWLSVSPIACVVSRTSKEHPFFSSNEVVLDTSTTFKHAAFSEPTDSALNGAAYVGRDHLVHEVELPFYSSEKFVDASDISTELHTEGQGHYVDIVDTKRPAHSYLTINQYVATGEDFNLTWYVNAPSFFVQDYQLLT